MKKLLKIIFTVLGVVIIGAVLFWQYNKKRIVRNALENVVSNKTDSLYYIHYDSSAIDAVEGNASFYNVVLQSDSLQQQLERFDTASTESIINVHVGEVSIRGANIPALLSNQKVEATSIKIIRPVIYIISSGTKKERTFSQKDTLAVYEKLLGKFSSIKAGEIVIEDGQLNFTHKIDSPYVSLTGINVNIKNVLIDSTKNYDNIVSYFIKDVSLAVKSTTIKNEEKNTAFTFTGLQYNASQKLLRLGKFQQTDDATGKVLFDINNTYIKGLNTDSFILKKQLKAEEFTSDGGLLVFFKKKKQAGSENSGDDILDLDNNFFDEALLKKIAIRNTTIYVLNKDRPSDAPFTLKNVAFTATDIDNAYSGSSVKNLIGKSDWSLSADGFSSITADQVYELKVGPFTLDKTTGKLHVDYFSVKPRMSEAEFVKGLKEQTDLYDIAINNIDLQGIDAKLLLTEKKLIAGTMTMQPVIKVSCDRTIPAFTGSKIGKYPHQLIQKLKFPIYIQKIIAKNGYVSYTERSAQSGQKGTVFFNNANGVIGNVTNIKDYISKNNILSVSATAKLLGVGSLKSDWKLPLNTTNGAFIISGNIGKFNALVLNPLIEPLALASITKGTIDGLSFNIEGNDAGSKGTSTLLYKDLKVEAMKMEDNELKKRGALSFLANLLVKDDNPKNGNTRIGETNVERDKTRSFFNLVWKGIFKAAKRVALGKDDD